MKQLKRVRDRVKQWLADLEGKPTITTTTCTPVTREFVMPAFDVYPPSRHAMTLTYRRTVCRWSVFWKRDVVISGFDVSVDDPPLYPTRGLARALGQSHDGIYGLFAKNCETVDQAMKYYVQRVIEARS